MFKNTDGKSVCQPLPKNVRIGKRLTRKKCPIAAARLARQVNRSTSYAHSSGQDRLDGEIFINFLSPTAFFVCFFVMHFHCRRCSLLRGNVYQRRARDHCVIVGLLPAASVRRLERFQPRSLRGR
jgi:hypothetical protein